MSLGDSSESKVPGKCGENVDLSNSKGCFLTASEGGGASSHIDCSTYPRDKNDINNTQTVSLLDTFKRHTQKLTKSRRSSSTLSASFEAGEEKVVLRKSTVLTEADADKNIDKMPKSTQSDKCEKLCGWLNKLGHRAIVKTYKSRWFVYGDNTCKLYYYRTPQDLLPLGEIDIHNASFSFDISNTAGPGQFQISSGGREYYLDATNRQTMLYWLEELQSKRRHFSNKRTSLSKTRVSVISANQKSIAEGLLGKRKSLVDHSDTDPTPGNHETSSDILIGQNSVSIQQAGSSFTNLSLTNLRTEIRNYVAGLRSPNSSPSGYSDKSAVEDWTVVDPESSPSLSPKSAPTVGQAPPTEAQTKLNNKFSFSNLRKILKKGNEDIEISAPSCNTLEPCQRCGQFKAYLSSLKEELTSVEEELAANREVTRLLQKEIDKLQAEVLSKQALDALDGATPEQLLKQRDDKIVDLEYLLTKTQEEKEMVRQQVREQGNVIGTQRDQVTMLQDMLTAKDDVIINLTNQLDALEKGHRSASDPTSVTTSPPVLRVFTDATEVERLKDSCDAYEMQNKFLSREILALNELRDNDEQREKLLQMQYANMEAKFYQTRSKYLFLLNELKEPVRGGSQDVIDQLLSEVLEADDETTVDLLNSQNSTIEYDRYGFLKTFETEEDILVTMATEMQRRSKELEIQIKEVDQSGVSHQVKWENFIVSLGERALEKSDEVKALVRGGIPHQHRETIWKACVNLRIQPKGSNYYEDLVKMSEKNKHNPAAKQIELDLLRTLPNNKYYESFESDGIPKLRRVLLAYSWHNPDIGYCQGLNRLVAIALLFLKEEDAFWCLVAIVESIMPPEYYTRTLMAAQADQRVLKDLLQQKLPRLHSHLEAHEVDLSLFTFNWFLTIFVDNIPPELFLRVWDSFLYEGNKVLFRFALAFFKYREEEILQQTTAININKYLRVIGQKMTDVRRLAEIAFTELNPFPARVITNRRHYHMIQVKAQLKQLDALREDFHSHIVPADRLEYYSDDDIDSDDKGGKLSPKEVPVTMTPALDAAALE